MILVIKEWLSCWVFVLVFFSYKEISWFFKSLGFFFQKISKNYIKKHTLKISRMNFSDLLTACKANKTTWFIIFVPVFFQQFSLFLKKSNHSRSAGFTWIVITPLLKSHVVASEHLCIYTQVNVSSFMLVTSKWIYCTTKNTILIFNFELIPMPEICHLEESDQAESFSCT